MGAQTNAILSRDSTCLGSVQKERALGNIFDDKRLPFRRDKPRDALADFVDSAANTFGVHSVGGFDEEVVAVAQGDGAAQQSHFVVEDCDGFGDEFLYAFALGDGTANLVEHGHFKVVVCFVNAAFMFVRTHCSFCACPEYCSKIAEQFCG